MAKKFLVSIIGTTGVGKSKFSIELAKAINGEIINADSMQMYKGLDIITNKHPIEEREGVPHHLLGHVDWDEEYYVHRFQKESLEVINDIHSRGKIPILIGGTHYYLQSVLFKNKIISEQSEFSPSEQEILNSDPDTILNHLRKVDPLVAGKFHPNDERRIKRALEVYFTTKEKTSTIYANQQNDSHEGSVLRFKSLIFWVWSDQKVLEPRLDKRIDDMLEHGLYDEIREMYKIHKSLNLEIKPQTPEENKSDLHGVWQVIGFKEFLPWLQDPSSSVSPCIERMKINTRKYSKRQIKWIKKYLAPSLEAEEQHNYSMGGQVCLLDATDLLEWESSVSGRGISLTKSFLEGNAIPPSELYKPDPKTAISWNAKPPEKWLNFTCPVCKNGDGTPLVLVGEDIWNIHEQSRRHRSTYRGIAKKRLNEERRKESERKKLQSTSSVRSLAEDQIKL